MDAGHLVANPNRFDDGLTPEGDPMELSALQHYYNRVADTSPEAVACEYDNDPPEEEAQYTGDLTPQRIQRQTSGLSREVAPNETVCLTQGIDVGKWRLHWVVRAWLPDATGYTIDYGTHQVYGQQYGTDQGLDRAIYDAVIQRMEAFNQTTYRTEDGRVIADTTTLVDAGFRTDSIYAACQQLRENIWPVMGFGKSMGCVKMNFSPTQKPTKTMKPGDGFKLAKVGKVWLVEADADRWKRWEHDRWSSEIGSIGCHYLFGESSEDATLTQDQLDHLAYAKHICSEFEREEFDKGTLRKRWRATSKENHWLDASYYADVAAAMRGVRLPVASTQKTVSMPTQAVPEEKKRVSFAEMQKKRRR